MVGMKAELMLMFLVLGNWLKAIQEKGLELIFKYPTWIKI